MAAGDLTASKPVIKSISERRGIGIPCASFDGVDDLITSSWDPNFTDSDFSVSLWVKSLDGVENDAIFLFSTSSTGAFWFQIRASSELRAVLITQAGGTVGTSARAFPNNAWNHLVATKDNSTLKLYINGVKAATDGNTSSTTDYRVSNSWFLGWNHGAPGYIKMFGRDLRIYNKALTTAEVLKLANNESVSDGLVGHWKLNGNALDSFGGNHGTVDGAIFVEDLEMNLAAATDNLIAEPTELLDGQIIFGKAERAAS